MTSALRSGQLQTTATDTGPGFLDGSVTGLDVIDPTENPPQGELTTLLEVDDEFDVRLSWELDGPGTTTVGGYWFVSLYSDDMDGLPTSTMTGLIAGPDPIQIVGGPSPLKFEHVFKVLPPTPQAGLYQLVATINHSPTQTPVQFSEMYGFAESTPVNIQNIPMETAVGAESA
jgi:hypothetical protein